MASKRKLMPMYKTDRSIHRIVTRDFLSQRVGTGKWGRSTWIRYCDFMLDRGYKVELYEAKETVSKYVTVTGNFDITFTIRFSNHAPSKLRMLDSEVKMCIGYSPDMVNYKLDDAINATLKWFNVDERTRESNRETCSNMGEERTYTYEEERDGGAFG